MASFEEWQLRNLVSNISSIADSLAKLTETMVEVNEKLEELVDATVTPCISYYEAWGGGDLNKIYCTLPANGHKSHKGADGSSWTEKDDE